MKRLLLLLLFTLTFFVSAYAQLYTERRRGFKFNQEAYDSLVLQIDKAESYEDLPKELEFITSRKLPIYQSTKDRDFISGKDQNKWFKVSEKEPYSLVKIKNIYQTDNVPNVNGDEIKQIQEPNIYCKYTSEYGTINKRKVIFLISNNLEKDAKIVTWGDLFVHGDIYAYVQRDYNFNDDYIKGYRIFEKWLEKATLIRQRECYVAKQKDKREKEVQDSLNQIRIAENNIIKKRMADSLANIRQDERIQRERDIIRKYGEADGKLILGNKVKLGFTKEMCIEAWGEPTDINKTTGSWGIHEQWVYNLKSYLYFENGILTTIQN